MRGSLEEEGLLSACLGRNILTHVLFDWFRGMSWRELEWGGQDLVWLGCLGFCGGV